MEIERKGQARWILKARERETDRSYPAHDKARAGPNPYGFVSYQTNMCCKRSLSDTISPSPLSLSLSLFLSQSVCTAICERWFKWSMHFIPKWFHTKMCFKCFVGNRKKDENWNVTIAAVGSSQGIKIKSVFLSCSNCSPNQPSSEGPKM